MPTGYPKPSPPTMPQQLSPVLTRLDDEIRVRFATLSTLAGVADLLEITPKYLRSILYSRRERELYRHFTIPKSSGGVRQIEAPPVALKILQEKLNRVFSLVYRPKPSVHGYVSRRSILTNANLHLGKRWVLNIDLEDFFPSIHLGRIRGALMSRGYSLPASPATVLAQLCTTFDGKLPQGAPTSPILSNIICSRLDGQMMALARRYGLTYSRYCDDISLSARQPLFPIDIARAVGGWTGDNVILGAALRDVIDSNKFAINPTKSRLQSKECRQAVTGITVNEFPNIAREYVKSLRGLLYAWKRHGLASAANEFARRTGISSLGQPELEAHFKAVARGRLEYIGFVRKRDDPIYCKLRDRLHTLAPTLIRAAPLPRPYHVSLYTGGQERWQRLFSRRVSSVRLLEVSVSTSGGNDISHGTAFSFNANCLATAAHCLKGRVLCISAAGNTALSTALIHPRGPIDVDAALLPLQHGLRPLQIDTRLPLSGEEVAVMGFASVPGRHFDAGLYAGTVEAVLTNYHRTLDLIQVSIPPGGGLSGAPLLDWRGRVIGIVIESAYEPTQPGIPRREYTTVLPIKYFTEIDQHGPVSQLPLTIR
jgi:RNA-directed DNA polymerase